jgi:hypothetical protein
MIMRKVSDTDLIIKFANDEAAKHFAIWLCESGEQAYWDWMRYREEELEEGDEDITAIEFHYHGEEDETKDESDPERYQEFMIDNTIRTTLGRLNDE